MNIYEPHYTERNFDQLVDGIKNSGIFVVVYTGNLDLKISTELGVAIFTDAKIVVIQERKYELPQHLEDIAIEILVFDDINKEREKISLAIQEVINRHGR